MKKPGRDFIEGEYAGVVDVRVQHDGVVVHGQDEISETFGALVALAGDVENQPVAVAAGTRIVNTIIGRPCYDRGVRLLRRCCRKAT